MTGILLAFFRDKKGVELDLEKWIGSGGEGKGKPIQQAC